MKREIDRAATAALGMAAAASLLGLTACAPAAAPPPIVLNGTMEGQGPVRAAPVRASFIASFRPSHALGRAQALQNAGRHEEAERLVAVTIRDNPALRGFCFERFTLGGAEIVLNVCAPSPWDDPLITQRRWLQQLAATPGVAYAELNLVAQPERAIEPPPS